MRILKRLLPALLALLVLTTTAFAAEEPKPFISQIMGDHDVSFTSEARDCLKVVVNDSAIKKGGEYLIMALEGDAATPKEDNLIYIGQATASADGTVTFETVYPTEMVKCTIYISGQSFTAPKAVCKIALSGGDVVLGDNDFDGSITANDAANVLKNLVGLAELDGTQLAASDTDGDGSVTANDAANILKYVVGLIGDF